MKGWVGIGWWHSVDATESEMKVAWILRARYAVVSCVVKEVI